MTSHYLIACSISADVRQSVQIKFDDLKLPPSVIETLQKINTVSLRPNLSNALKKELDGLNKKDVAKKVGELAAKRCLDAKVTTVVFDRKLGPELQYAATRAHNRGILEFCENDSRLLAVTIVPLEDPARARPR